MLIALGLLCVIGGLDALVLTQDVQRATSQLATTQESTSDSARLKKMRAEAVKVIAEGFKRNIEDGKAGKMAARRKKHISPKDVSKVLTRANSFLNEKRALVAAHEHKLALNTTNGKKGEKCGAACIIGDILDGFFILAKMGHMGICPPVTMLLWWVIGITTLMTDMKLGFDEAIFVLGQQVTTVGYGSHCPETAGMKMFHALHSVFAVLLVSTPTYQLANMLLKPMMDLLIGKSSTDATSWWVGKYLPLALTVVASTFGYAEDFHAADGSTYPEYADALLDALYMTLITLTTIGYGDMNPSTTAGMITGTPWMVWGTNIFLQSFVGKEDLAELADGKDVADCSALWGPSDSGMEFFNTKTRIHNDIDADLDNAQGAQNGADEKER